MLQNIQADFVDALNDANLQLEQIEPVANLSVYREHIRTQLQETLERIYPLLIKLVGQKFFRSLAQHYIDQYPSRHSYLQAYGEYFSDFVANFPGTCDLPYLKEIATFEWAFFQVSFAAEYPPFNPALLNNLTPEQAEKIRLTLHPASQLLNFEYPILEIIDLCTGGRDEEVNLDQGGIYMLLLRPALDVKLVALNRAEFIFLQALQRGEPLSAALTQAQAVVYDFDLEKKLPLWIKNQVIVDCY